MSRHLLLQSPVALHPLEVPRRRTSNVRLLAAWRPRYAASGSRCRQLPDCWREKERAPVERASLVEGLTAGLPVVEASEGQGQVAGTDGLITRGLDFHLHALQEIHSLLQVSQLDQHAGACAQE